MKTNHADKGTALVASLIVIFVIAGLVASTFTITLSATNESEYNNDFATALEDAQAGLQRALATVNSATITENGIAGFENNDSSQWIAFLDDDGSNPNPYTVYVRSFKELNRDVGDNYDIYEITSVSDPIGRKGLQRAVQAVVEIPYGTAAPENLTDKEVINGVFSAALGLASDSPYMQSAVFRINGSDHAVAGGGPGVPALAYESGGSPAVRTDYLEAVVEDDEGNTTTLTGDAAVTNEVPPIDDIIELFLEASDGPNYTPPPEEE